MAAIAGRNVRIKYDSGTGAAVIAGARVDNATLNRGMIDITDKDDAGIRTLLDDVALVSMSMTISGLLVGTTLIDLAKVNTAGSQLHSFEILATGIGDFAGEFFISSFEMGGEDGENAATFSCTLESSGAITWTAA